MINEVKEAAKHAEGYVVEMRRYFHAHPEVSTKEYETSKRIGEELTKMGLEWRHCGLETGIVCDVKGKFPGKTFMIRADIDALTVTEDTGLPFTSQNHGVMHACGHDCHIAVMLAAAKMLTELRDQIHGTVRICFQPAEETAQGAKSMVEEGALEGVSACFGLHVWSDADAGKVSIDAGPRMASGDKFTIDVIGKSGHGAQPHRCVDATVVAAAVIQNLQSMVSREIDPTQTAVVTVGTVTSGSRWNVISGAAHMEGTTRCFDPEVRQNFPKQIERIAKETAAAYRAEAKVTYDFLVPPTINNPAIVPYAQGAAKEVFGDDWDAHYGVTMGGEDFSYFLEKIPGCFALLGVRSEAADSAYPQHSCHYKVDESALIKGAMLHVMTALSYLEKNA